MGAKTKVEVWIEIAERFKLETGQSQYTKKEIAAFGYKRKLVEIGDSTAIKLLANEAASALRRAELDAPDGTPTRQFACCVIEQKMLWSDIRDASPAFAIASFKARKKQCDRSEDKLQTDVDVWNKFYKPPDMRDYELD